MISFFHKKQKVHVDCFTYFNGITKLFPIQYAHEIQPTWFKEVPTSTKSQSGATVATVRTCPGMQELFKKGIVIPSWCDLYVNANNNDIQTEPAEMAESHPTWQWNNHVALKDYMHLKIASPWKFKEKTGVNFLFTNVFWSNTTDQYFVPNGLVEYKYQNTTNINMWVRKTFAKKEFTISAGTPLAQIIPLDDKEIVIHMHEIDEKEYVGDELDYIFTQTGQYYKRKKILSKKGTIKE